MTHCFIEPLVPIHTAQGSKRIGAIAVGSLVLTHRGRFRPVTQILSGRQHTGTVYSFVTTDTRRIPWVTGPHPLLTSEGWVPASEIQERMSLMFMARTCATCGGHFTSSRQGVRHCSRACWPLPATGNVPMSEARAEMHEAERGDSGWASLSYTADPVPSVDWATYGFVMGGLRVAAVEARQVVDATLYNLAVEEDESYVVASGAIVHNCRRQRRVKEDGP